MKNRSFLLLALLAANDRLGEPPVHRTTLVKQAFLAETIRPLYRLWLRIFGFVRYYYGPYTDEIFQRLDTLIFNGLVRVAMMECIGGRVEARYQITAAGHRVLEYFRESEIVHLAVDLVWALQALGVEQASTICKLVYQEAEFARVFAQHSHQNIGPESKVPLPAITETDNETFVTLAILQELRVPPSERTAATPQLEPREVVRLFLLSLAPNPSRPQCAEISPMSASLFDLAKLISHAQSFSQPAACLGFSTPGDIERFLFKSYGRAIREIPPADRPRGALFVLARPGIPSALASPGDLKPVLLQIQRDIARRFYEVPADLAGGIKEVQEVTSAAQRQMASGAWTPGQAQWLSRHSGSCVVWGNGVYAAVFLAGDSFLESPDVVEELPTGLPSSFQSLSWADGEIAYEFADNELNDTSDTGIWQLPEQFLLRPKPEKIMSVGLGRFLRLRMAGYRHHEDEAHVENEGRADISLVLYNGLVNIIEVKWVGTALVAKRQLTSDTSIKAALKEGSNGWVIKYDDATFGAGARQLTKYFKTGKYHRAYLAVFDCCKPKAGRKHECRAIDPADVAPYDCAKFRAYRACVDPRKASKSSKRTRP